MSGRILLQVSLGPSGKECREGEVVYTWESILRDSAALRAAEVIYNDTLSVAETRAELCRGFRLRGLQSKTDGDMDVLRNESGLQPFPSLCGEQAYIDEVVFAVFATTLTPY